MELFDNDEPALGFSFSFAVVFTSFGHFKRTKFVIRNCKQETTLHPFFSNDGASFAGSHCISAAHAQSGSLHHPPLFSPPVEMMGFLNLVFFWEWVTGPSPNPQPGGSVVFCSGFPSLSVRVPAVI